MAIEVIQEDEEQRARAMLLTAEEKPSALPDVLLEILTTIIKPLFSSQHPQLTETGRKRLISAPSIPGTFNHDSIFDNSRPWKNGWTATLLLDMVSRYYYATAVSARKKTVEAHFHLLIPPILNMIDDSEFTYKVQGCQCLTALSNLVLSAESDIMKRTGLAEVFIDTLKTNFAYLPPLTSETESLSLLESLYPAFFALVAVRFQSFDKTNNQVDTTTAVTSPKADEGTLRQNYLGLLLRHSLLYSINNLSNATNENTTSSSKITTYLLTQIPHLARAMGKETTRHIQQLLPLLSRIMSDPFATAAPEMLLAAAEAMHVAITVCGEPVITRWWGECLRALVACWLNIEDDEETVEDGRHKAALERVKISLRAAVMLLRTNGNEDELDRGTEQMISIEERLKGLFERN